MRSTAQSNCISEATRLDPIAVAAQPAIEYIKDVLRETYQTQLWLGGPLCAKAGELTMQIE